MVFIYILGKRFLGRVDNVAGVCYVVTLFAHGFWFPLFPMGSYLIPAGEGAPDVIDGVRIPLSWKSVTLGYARAVCVVTAALSLLWANSVRHEVSPYDGKPMWTGLVVTAAIAIAVLVGSYLFFWRATPKRMAELAAIQDLRYSISSKLRTLSNQQSA
jgi:hypothetical protein